jgi:hypothetical protein
MNLKLEGLTKQDMLHLAELPSLSERKKKMGQLDEPWPGYPAMPKSQSTELSEGDFVYTCDGRLGLIRKKEPHYFKVIIIGSYATATYGHSAVEKITLNERTKNVLDKFLAQDLLAVKGVAISVTPTDEPSKPKLTEDQMRNTRCDVCGEMTDKSGNYICNCYAGTEHDRKPETSELSLLLNFQTITTFLWLHID